MFDIKQYRISKGLTQTDIANILSVSKSMVSQVESGRIAIPELWESKLMLSNINTDIASEPQERYHSISKKKESDQEYLAIIAQLVASNEILARSVEKMADNITRISEIKIHNLKHELV